MQDHRRRTGGMAGFTLVELMVAVVVAAILAAVAIPSYTSFIDKSRARDASADLAALALNLQNQFQLQLGYPVNPADTEATTAKFSGWSPTQKAHFRYTLVSTANAYTLTATGRGRLAGCTMSLTEANVSSASAACGFTAW
ncbi:type IV pilin protein [Roseateles sp. DAIF2]|uniref:type IV pilin protein n=1 Tax=Roseateles sp. DAIF2 TaxID=2714952 RepID=UPI001BC95344|nr:type IV pilin protein [Roseateles sp. DAIF2]